MVTRKPLTAYENHVSFGALLGVAFLMLGLLAIDSKSPNGTTANVLQAVSPSEVTRIEETLLSQPRHVEWGGYVRRVFVGGDGLEIAGSDAPGGVFQAYGAERYSDFGERVLIRGIWRGYTCAYGGNEGRCVPEVDIESLEDMPIDY